MEAGHDQTNPCAICLGGMRAGDGQATFTAECSHTFHFSCIAASVAHGNLVCPLCNAQWRHLPFVMPQRVPAPPPLPPQWRNHHVGPVVRPQRVPAPPPQQPDVDPVVVSWYRNRFPRRLVPAPPALPPQWRDHHVRPVVMPPRRNHHVDPVVVVVAVPQSVNTAPPQQRRNHYVGPVVVIFDDDEQVEPVSGVLDSRPSVGASASAETNGAVVVKTHTEWSAVARDSSSDNFAVLVHLKAPGMVATDAAPRASLDLVTVLDVSGSMSGQKLALLKQAMRFVIDNLGPDDRLSVVSFSSEARRVTRLARMTDAGKASCVRAVESLSASGGTNIAEGLRTAAKVLDERRHRNAVSSVVLLSDGQDTYTMVTRRDGGANYEALVPPSFLRTGGEWSAPIHTFGFGNDHDAAAMHVIAEATGGTFSFIENEEVIQDAFAQCIGGLLSVVVQEARIAVACLHPGVRVVSIRSGRYESRVDEDGRAAAIRVGELYADEERRFLLLLAVPRAEESDGNTTALVKVIFNGRDAATGLDVSVTAEDAVVARPENAVGAERSAEVERERVRVEAAEDIAAARAAAERGDHEEAAEILESRQRVVAQSEGARDGDPVIVALGAELREMRGRVSSRHSYRRSGRAYMLAGMSAHTQQRANSRQMLPSSSSLSFACARRMSSTSLLELGAAWSSEAGQEEASKEATTATMSYATPAMRAMLLRSQRARQSGEGLAEQGQQPKAGPEVQKT